MKFLFLVLVVGLFGCRSPAEQGAKESGATLSDEQKSALDKAENDPLFAETDIGLWVRGDTVVRVLNSINSVRQANRTVILQVTSEKGLLVDEPAYFVELEDFPNDRVIGSLSSVNASWTSAGQLAFTANLSVSGSLRIHAHAKKPVDVGGHVGVSVDSSATINGMVGFSMNDKGQLHASFDLLPSPLKISLNTGIADKKELCYRLEAFGKEIGKDCKVLWDYNIPINVQRTETIKTDTTMVMPIQIALPEEMRLQREVLGTKFDKTIHVSARPKDFRSDSLGLALRVAVNLAEEGKQ